MSRSLLVSQCVFCNLSMWHGTHSISAGSVAIIASVSSLSSSHTHTRFLFERVCVNFVMIASPVHFLSLGASYTVRFSPVMSFCRVFCPSSVWLFFVVAGIACTLQVLKIISNLGRYRYGRLTQSLTVVQQAIPYLLLIYRALGRALLPFF